MKSVELKKQIRNLSELYAVKRNTEINSSYETAVIFLNIRDNFFSESFESIEKNEIWKQRLTKRHPNVKDTFEMQSSFWQEICSSVGQNLKQFLKGKYGISIERMKE